MTKNAEPIDALHSAYTGQIPRPDFVHLLSKSLPRAGHHYLVSILARLYGKAFEYCEYYQPTNSECCKTQPCTKACNSERIKDGKRHVSMQKSHDFELADDLFEPYPWLKYVVMVRDFRPAVSSEVKLFLIHHYSRFLAENNIDSREILKSHNKTLYRQALTLIDDAKLCPDPNVIKQLLNDRFQYHLEFRKKWEGFAQAHIDDAIVIDYDDLVGGARAITIERLVNIIGIEPEISIESALTMEPVMTAAQREAEESQAANNLLDLNKDILDNFERLLIGGTTAMTAADPAPLTLSFMSKEGAKLLTSGPRMELSPLTHTYLDLSKPLPTLSSVGSQLCTANQFDEPAYAYWCREIRQERRLHRKQWEFVYILEVLKQSGMLTSGKRGLGFGCGQEPIPAILAKHGCSIVATDLETKDAVGKGWIETGQHARQLADLNQSGICTPDQFAERVTFRPADMNAIDEELRGFDFIWSSCAFEHLGSISHGLNFVLGALACLRPGGIAVHTTEFNITSNFRTIESRDLSIFRRYDIDRLGIMLDKMGADLLSVNYNPGTTPLDQHFDIPPYRKEPHLKLRLGGYVITSIGLAIQKR